MLTSASYYFATRKSVVITIKLFKVYMAPNWNPITSEGVQYSKTRKYVINTITWFKVYVAPHWNPSISEGVQYNNRRTLLLAQRCQKMTT